MIESIQQVIEEENSSEGGRDGEAMVGISSKIYHTPPIHLHIFIRQFKDVQFH